MGATPSLLPFPGPGAPIEPWIRALPKAELHVHLDGSLRPATMVELARDRGIRLPEEDPERLGRFMRADDSPDLVAYLERFRWTLTVLQDEEAMERVAFELAEDLAGEGVRYAEIRFAPLLNAERGMSAVQALEAAIRGLRSAEAAHPIRTGVIVCGIRSLPPARSAEMARLAVEFQGRGVVGFDLAAAEAGNPPLEHREAFRIAAGANLPVTIHAGEAWGAESIHQAIHGCGARRIGHGTRLWEDPGLLAYIRDFRIPLEVCLTSNVQTGVSLTFEDHPVRRYLDEGLVVTLNTDNRLISGTTMTEEYLRAHRHLGFTAGELAIVTRMAFESAFLPLPEREALLAGTAGLPI